jgi:hypothetical protein
MMKMKIKSVFIFFVLSLFSAGLYAKEYNEIDLIDGSTIYGEIVSFNAGVYTVKSSSLGTLKVAESDIREIRVKSANQKNRGPASPENGSIGSDVQALQTFMQNDQEIMAIIFSLQNDPDFQKIISDPDVLNAVNSGDIAALISNPKFMSLLNNQKIQQIQKKLTQ